MNRSGAFLVENHPYVTTFDTEAQPRTPTFYQENQLTTDKLKNVSSVSTLEITDDADIAFHGQSSMRIPSDKKKFLDKINNFSIAPHVFLQSYSTRLNSSVKVKQNFSSQHPFSNEFQHIFQERSQPGNIVHQKRIQAVKDFLNHVKNNIQDKYSFLPIDQFNPVSSTTNLATYLLERVDDSKLHHLMSELTYFYQSIFDIENDEVVKVAFSIFPPNDPEDFKCLEGTRSRLFSAIAYLKDNMSEGDDMSLKSTLDQKIAQAGESVIEDTIIKENFRFLLHDAVEVHSKNFLSYLSGVSSSIVEKKDGYYLSPLAEVPSFIAHDFLSNFSKNLNAQTLDYKKILMDQFDHFFDEVYKFDDKNSSLSDLSNHLFLKYISSLDSSFDLKSDKYLIPEDEYYFSFLLDKEKLLSSVFSILENSLSVNSHKNHISLLDSYSSNASKKIKSMILSNDKDQLVSAIHTLYVLGENFRGNSPVEFLSILIDIAKSLPNFNNGNTQVISKLFSSIANQLASDPMYASEKEKLDKIQSRFEYYFSIPRDEKDRFENLISFKLGKRFSFSGLFLEYAKGGASLHRYNSLMTSEFNRSAKSVNYLLFRPKNISKLIFHPEFKSIANKFFPYITKESIENMIYYSIYFCQEDKLLDLLNNNFLNFNLCDIENNVQRKVLALVFKRKNYALAEKLLDLGFNPKGYLDVNESTAVNLGLAHQDKNLIRIAAKDKQFSLLKKLIDKGIKIEHLSLSQPFSLLKMAFNLGDADLLTFLFSQGLTKKLIDADFSLRICHEVASLNLSQFIPILMQHGFTPHDFAKQEGRGMTAVHMAAKNGHLDIIEKLFDASLSEDAFLEKDVHGHSAFEYFLASNNVAAIETLLNRGIPLEKLLHCEMGVFSKRTTLQYLALKGRAELFQFFCQRIPKNQVHHYLSQTSKGGKTLAHFAVKNINEHTSKIIETLREYLTCNEITARDRRGKNLFHVLSEAQPDKLTSEQIEISLNLLQSLSSLVDAMQVNALDHKGHSPVHLAAMNSNFDMVSVFFDQFKLSPDILDKKVALHFWQKKRSLAEIVKSQGKIELLHRIELLHQEFLSSQ